jgi:hypothetical protein
MRRQIIMTTWILTLDQEEAMWLSNLMKSMRDAYHDDKALILGSTDAVNAIDIIQQIDQVNVPKTKGIPELHIRLENEEE